MKILEKIKLQDYNVLDAAVRISQSGTGRDSSSMSTATPPVLTAATVSGSYRYCREMAKERAKNFYYSFLLLEKPRRDAMCAVYAFMRHCDDLSDDPENTIRRAIQQSISFWRLEMDRALKGIMGDNPLWPAFCDTVSRYAIPHRFFHEMIDGVMSDIGRGRWRPMKSFTNIAIMWLRWSV